MKRTGTIFFCLVIGLLCAFCGAADARTVQSQAVSAASCGTISPKERGAAFHFEREGNSSFCPTQVPRVIPPDGRMQGCRAERSGPLHLRSNGVRFTGGYPVDPLFFCSFRFNAVAGDTDIVRRLHRLII